MLGAGLTVLSHLDGTSTYGRLAAGLTPLGAGLGLAMPPATTAITDALPKELQNVGSAVNDLAGELGGALGIAVLGSLLTAAYRSDLHPTGVPPRVAEAAESSLAGAAAGGTVLHQAQTAFITGLRTALLAAAVTAVAVAILLRRSPGTHRGSGQGGDPQSEVAYECSTGRRHFTWGGSLERGQRRP
ncbi:hypothetical protein AB0I54_05075 [Streptomyces sp. NPDC050625]|uniref:hypothetical protein n=1 Tax=Streptomyces sp. NPDC050625 TaxID=3154629 RepID=UPI003436845D